MMRNFIKRLAIGIFLALPWIGTASAQQTNNYCFIEGTAPPKFVACSAANPLQISGAITLTFPTIGAAVPSTGIYNGINVAGTLRGLSGLSTGSLFPAAVAIVDASGTQITSFGATGSTSNASSAVATSSTNVPTVSYNYGFNGSTWDQLQVSSTKNLLIDVTTSSNNLYAALTAPIAAGTNSIGNVGPLAYPIGATPITASATGTTGATTATLAGTSGKTTYICGYSIRANATANTNVTNTITGVITATLSSIMWVPANTAGLGVDEQIFSPCIPASGTNQAIAVVSGAPGTGGLVSSKGWGYQL